MLLERRVLKRHNIFICVNFRSLIETTKYSFGITNDFTRQGFNFESQDHGIESGHNIEFIFRNYTTVSRTSHCWQHCGISGITTKNLQNQKPFM